MPRSIPDRWLEYRPYGAVIEGTKIIPFKVPLRKELTRDLPAEQRFTPELLMETFPKLKCIIDLTNTNRYYSREEFEKAGLKYLKLMILGHEVPHPRYVRTFINALEEFNLSIKSDELIGVHCTHGINRSGYLICRYITQGLGWTPLESLNAFAKARGYRIERPAYVAALMGTPHGHPANHLNHHRRHLNDQNGGMAAEQPRTISSPPPTRPARFFRPRATPYSKPAKLEITTSRNGNRFQASRFYS